MANAVSLFSGSGGCSFGLKQAGFDIALAADNDPNACETYAANVGGRFWATDLTTAQPEDIWERSRLKPAAIDLIIGGPPCQGFSSAGAKNWEDPRNALVRNFVRLVTRLKPTWFVMENVEGLLTAGEGIFLVEAVTRFLTAGYWVRAKKVYMEEHGLPQRRKRVFLVGNLEHCEFQFPDSDFHRPEQMSLFMEQPHFGVLDAIADLPELAAMEGSFYKHQPQNRYQAKLRRMDNKPVRHHRVKPLNRLTQQRIGLLVQGSTMKDLPEDLQHLSFKRRALRRVMDGTPTEKRGGAPSGLKRLLADRPSLTVTSASPSEFVHPLEDRLLTLRECARLQSFPDSFEFSGGWNSVATQIGNAIPPLFARLLGVHIRHQATWQPISTSRGCWLGIEATKSMGTSPALARTLVTLEERTRAFAR